MSLTRRLIANLVSPLTRANGRQRLAILIYHRVLPVHDDYLKGLPTVDNFRWQMELLAEFFNPLPLDEAMARMEMGELPPRAVCVTFDDGYADNEQLALPVLESAGVPATVFVSSGHLDGGIMWNDVVIEAIRSTENRTLELKDFSLPNVSLQNHDERRKAIGLIINSIKHWNDERRSAVVQRIRDAVPDLPTNLMLTEAQLRNLRASNIEIGGHTISHPILSSIDDGRAEEEIRGNKRRLEDILGAPVRYFAYPNGMPGADYDERHVAMVKKLGFQAAFSTRWGVNSASSDRWQLSRFTPWDKTPERFLLRLLTHYRNLV